MIVHPEAWGKLVTALYRPPSGRFTLPDGYPAVGADGQHSCWVCESLGSLFWAPIDHLRRNHRLARYGVIHDRYLKPLPGESADSSIDKTVDEPVAA